jgi:hypothetical protein
MNTPRYLTKSRFKLATECPTKLFYTNKKEYPDSKLDDPFLEALADGGFQVGELAKRYFPGGHDITALDYQTSIEQTNELLKRDKVVIFEPAIQVGSYLVRVDILVKNRNHFELIEVKAKSYSSKTSKPFINKKGKIDSGWKPYILDVAFQKYVLQTAFPNATITPYLMLVDKDIECHVDGLNQKFKLKKDENNRKGVSVSSTLSDDDLSVKLLRQINVDDAVKVTFEKELTEGYPAYSFIDNIKAFARHYEQDIKIAPVIGKKCKKCEFRATKEQEAQGLNSGFKACWKEQLRWSEADFDSPTVLELANFRRADKLIEEGKIKLKDVSKEDIGYSDSNLPEMSTVERQWLQIESANTKRTRSYFDAESMRREMAYWTYPLHFIDFETSSNAIPFFKGTKPYEGIAFQFSHHKVHEDGRVEHANQYLNTTPHQFPNFAFIRELKAALDGDNGTIFRYSNHENAFLNTILNQLQSSNEPYKDELIDFIKTITKSSENSSSNWLGERNMVDQLELVKKYYYHPSTKGSNSIKHVLPAILNESEYLQTKYSKPIYGTEEIISRNFNRHIWVKFNKTGKVMDPYKTLPRLFEDFNEHDVKLLSESTLQLNNGGLALTAYARMQFTEMSDYERKQLTKGLYKYCELDTMAMVMIHEGWVDMINNPTD